MIAVITVEQFVERLTAIFNAAWSWVAQLTNTIVNDMLLSVIFGIFVIRLLAGFFDRLRRIF